MKKNLPTNYNELSRAERREVREQYRIEQEDKCYYCGELLTCDPSKDVRKIIINAHLFPSGFFKWPVHLHHCHKTGMTIGAVHAYCNAVLWQYEGE